MRACEGRRADAARCFARALQIGLLALAPALASGEEPPAVHARAPERVRVFYPRGECETAVLEIQIFERESREWQAHPEHPTIKADTCHAEDPGQLLQEIRYRCIDPASPGSTSEWRVGVEVFSPREAPGCLPAAGAP